MGPGGRKSAADGYTLAVVSAGYAFTPAIYEQAAYDRQGPAGVSPLANGCRACCSSRPALGVTSAQSWSPGESEARRAQLRLGRNRQRLAMSAPRSFRAATRADVVHCR